MIIVIGATSFIGVHTVTELLNQGCKVLVTGRKNRFKEHYDALGVEYVNLDLNNEKDFEKLCFIFLSFRTRRRRGRLFLPLLSSDLLSREQVLFSH